MMTIDTKRKKLASVRRLSLVTWNKWCNVVERANKLSAYNTLLEPPKTINTANYVHAMRLHAEAHNVYELYKKLEQIGDKLEALPALSTYVSMVDNKPVTIVLKGHLPNFDETAENEDEALQMLSAYCAAKEAKLA